MSAFSERHERSARASLDGDEPTDVEAGRAVPRCGAGEQRREDVAPCGVRGFVLRGTRRGSACGVSAVHVNASATVRTGCVHSSRRPLAGSRVVGGRTSRRRRAHLRAPRRPGLNGRPRAALVVGWSAPVLA